MEKIPLYLDRKFVTFIGFRFFLKVFIFFLKLYFIIIRSILFWLHCVACGILIPQSGIEHGTMAVRAHNPNYWTARELPKFIFKENQDQFKTGEGLFFP